MSVEWHCAYCGSLSRSAPSHYVETENGSDFAVCSSECAKRLAGNNGHVSINCAQKGDGA